MITRAPPRRGYPTRLHPWHCQLAAPTARCLARPTQRARCQVLVDCLATQTDLLRVPGVGVRLPAARAQARGRATLRLLRVTRPERKPRVVEPGDAAPHKRQKIKHQIEGSFKCPFFCFRASAGKHGAARERGTQHTRGALLLLRFELLRRWRGAPSPGSTRALPPLHRFDQRAAPAATAWVGTPHRPSPSRGRRCLSQSNPDAQGQDVLVPGVGG